MLNRNIHEYQRQPPPPVECHDEFAFRSTDDFVNFYIDLEARIAAEQEDRDSKYLESTAMPETP